MNMNKFECHYDIQSPVGVSYHNAINQISLSLLIHSRLLSAREKRKFSSQMLQKFSDSRKDKAKRMSFKDTLKLPPPQEHNKTNNSTRNYSHYA